MEKINFTLNKLPVMLMVLLACLFGQQYAIGQNCTAPNQCTATTGFPDAPAGFSCGAPFSPVAIFTEDFDNGFGIFTEDVGPNSPNNLTVSTNGDTPSGGTGPETTAGCNGNANDGEFIFLETSFDAGETHCMSASIPLPAVSPTVSTPYSLSFWYYMFGDNIGTLEIFINGGSVFSVSGQQQTANCQDWLQGAIDVSALAGTSPTVQICMTEGVGSSTFEGDISIDHIQVFACAEVCQFDCSASPLMVDNDPGLCGATVSPAPVLVGPCNNPVINDFNNTADATDFYPPGSTIVTFTTTDDFGNPVSCTIEVIVTDTEGPSFSGCEDETINLDPTECCSRVVNLLTVVDNCAGGGMEAGALSTIFTNGNGASGNMFDIENLTNGVMTIGPIWEGNIEPFGGPPDISVYFTTTASTFVGNETNPAAWTLVGTANNVISLGQNTPTPFDVGGTFTLMPGQSVGVFVSDNTSSIDYTNGSNTFNDGNIEIRTGIGRGVNVANPFAGGIFNPRTWNGTINYTIGTELEIVQTDMTGLTLDDCFPIGETTLEFLVTDPGGNTSTCEKTITVIESIPTSITMACNDLIHVTLDTLCEGIVTPDMVLEGDNYGCLDNYIVDLFYDAALTQLVPTSPMLTSNDIGRLIYTRVTDPFIGLTCWGTAIAEDKLPPVIECPCDQGGDPVTSVSGEIDPGDPTWNRTNNFGNNPGNCAPTAGGVESYETFDFSISAPDVYTFSMPNNVGPDFFFVLYEGGFDPTQPCTNAIAADDDTNGTEPEITIALTLVPGNYTLVTTTFATAPNSGPYTYTITSAAGGQVLARDAACNFLCFEDLANAPVPTATDACGIASLTSSDQEIDGGNCGVSTVLRTWIATDLGGNTAVCTQELLIAPGTLDDVTGPANFDGIDGRPTLLCQNICGGDLELADDRFCGPSDLYWNVLPAGHPYAGHPSPYDGKTWNCGDVKCFGTGEPGGANTCDNIQSTFEDTRINICTTGSSDGCYKIVRLWSSLDWCTGEIAFFTQILKIDDNEAPEIADIDDITISTDVWRCEVDWLATEAWLDDNCSDIVGYTITSTGGTPELIGGRWVIRGLTPGVYDVTYSAADCCGNVRDSVIQLTVIDDVPPVAICDAHTVVSITRTGNINQDNLGITKIFAETFDDGSFDNCSPDIWFKAVRMDEYDSNGNGKTPETVQQGDWASIACDAANGDDDLRVFPPWYQGPQSYLDDYVKFCCDDIAAGPVMVVFAVFDIDPEPFTFGRQFPQLVPPGENPDDYNGVLPQFLLPGGALDGHYSLCMVEVDVQDKLPPVVVAPPNITVTCDKWFPFDPDNPNDYTDEFDAIFGKVVEGSADPLDRDSIVCRDRVCPAHPRFAEFAPASIFDDPCYDDQYDIFWGYDGYALDNCNINLEQTIIPALHCARGTILRRWRAADDAGNWSNIATQTITVIDCKEWYVPKVCWRFTPKDVSECDLVNITPNALGVCNNIFDPSRVGLNYLIKLIEWPCDIELNRCQGPTSEVFKPENLDVFFDQDRRPRMDDDNCNLMASTYEDRVFTFVDSSCLKIFRDWTVIDWCLYEDFVNGVYSGEYEWHWTQVIKLLNEEGPTFDNCSQTVCGYGNPGNPNAPQCVGEVTIDPGISDDCTELDALRIDYKFDYNNDGSYDELGYSDTYGNIYPFPNPNFLPVRRFAAADYAITGFYPVGTHRILWAAEDGCGNLNICEYILTIDDCKPPTAYCHVGVSTIPMPISSGGYIDIWASDFDLDSYDNCTAQEDLIFSFSIDPNDRSIRRTCDDVTGLPESLTIYVWDEAGNYATCDVGLLLADCLNQTQYAVSGGIANEEGENIEQVEVHVDGSNMNDMQVTGPAGFFGFTLDADNNYTVTPEKDINPLNGVSTFDLVLISKHILGTEALNSPYKMIAADVNRSGSITTFDIVELRKLILFINTDFPNNTSWRFVDAHFNFPNPANPFQTTFPEDMNINGLGANMTNVDFVGVKVGDVNCSAQPNNLIGSDGRSAVDDLIFRLDDKQLNTGAEYTVEFLAKDFAAAGYQFTLNFDKSAVAFEGVEAGELTNLTDANFGLSLLNKGVITTSWANNAAVKMADDEVVFSVTFRAIKDVLLSEVLSVSSDYTAAEAYTADLDLLNVKLEFNAATTSVSDEFALMQNQPNPFKDETTIGFVLPQASTATLTVYDVAGRVLKVYPGDYAKGYNEISINRSELGGVGVLYYTLKSDDNSATKKMILLD